MKLIKLVLVSTLTVLSFNAFAQRLTQPILLWPAGAPGATGVTDEDKPSVIPFIPEASKRNGAAVLVVPGGGNTIRAVDHEGVLVAQWLKEHGITAFLLRYRLRPIYSKKDWDADGQRGMQFIRAHADEYHISADRVGAVGFSAGVPLIADLALATNVIKTDGADALDKLSFKPDFLILAYGSTNIPDNIDAARIAAFPPTFMYGTVEDRSSQNGMLNMYTRLYRGNAPIEAHFFRNGIHGTGFAVGDPVLGQYTTLLHNWLAVGGFLTPKEQIPLAGVVKLNGTPLLNGMVILTPVNDKNAPPVVVYIRNTGTGELGRFLVPKSQGPIDGKYKVEVRQDATRWVSNSREPYMISMSAKRGELTDADKKVWRDYMTKRDLSPSIENQRVYRHKYPNDKSDYIIDIKNGSEILIEVFSK